jgi:hypothetical protein
MIEQIRNLLTEERNNIKFSHYLRSIGAEIRPATNQYEAARFVIKGKTCVIYWKESKQIFTYSDDFTYSIHEDWRKQKKKKKPKINKSELGNALNEVKKILGNLMYDWEFVRYIKKEYDGHFSIDDIKTIEEARVAYKCIKAYRKIFLKEEV